MKTIGEKLLILREERNLKQKELAELAGITEATLSRYENGKREPKGEIISRLAKILNVTTDYLLNDEDSNKKIDTYLDINPNELFADQLINGFKDKNINLDSLSKEEKAQLIKKIIAVTIALKDD